MFLRLHGHASHPSSAVTKRFPLRLKSALLLFHCLLLSLFLSLFLILISGPGYAAGPTAGQELRAMGLIEGKAGGNLAENEELTRTEMMVILARMLGEFPQASSWSAPSTFTDRKSGFWGEPYVAYAQYKGWTSGIGANFFGYEQRHTVQEASVFMLKALGYQSPEDFQWANTYETAKGLNLFRDLSLNPEENILRGDLFQIMLNTLETEIKGQPLKLGEKLGVLIPPSLAGPLAQSRANTPMSAVRIGDKWGYMSAEGKLALRFLYDQAYDFSDGLAAVSIGGKFGFVDKAGSFVIPLSFEDAGDFVNGLAPAKSGGKYGYIDKTGAWVHSPAYDFADQFSEGLARVVVSGKVGFINTEGIMVAPPAYERANRFLNGVAAVQINSLIGYLDKNGKQLLSPRYLIAGNGASGLFRYNAGTSIGFMSATGASVIPARYLWADHFSEGLAAVETEPSGGTFSFHYINPKGERVLAQSYQDAYAFSEGLAFVMTGGKYGAIDKSGKMVISPRFLEVDPEGFSSGLARVIVNQKVGIINARGDFVIQPQFDESRRFVK